MKSEISLPTRAGSSFVMQEFSGAFVLLFLVSCNAFLSDSLIADVVTKPVEIAKKLSENTAAEDSAVAVVEEALSQDESVPQPLVNEALEGIVSPEEAECNGVPSQFSSHEAQLILDEHNAHRRDRTRHPASDMVALVSYSGVIRNICMYSLISGC